MNYYPKSKSWFLERIGKRIYRNADKCDCNSCEDVVDNGLVVKDKAHAHELALIDTEFANCGTFLNYRDEK